MASLFSVLAAVLITQSRNDAIPEYEAVAAITYNRLLGEVDDSGAQERLSTAEQIALSVNEVDLSTGIDPLSPGVRAEVVASEPDLRLLFIGRHATPEQASKVATGLLDGYLAAQQLDISQEFAQRIADTAARLDEVFVAIAVATPAPDINDLEASARMRELQAEVNAFAGLYGAFTTELIAPRNPPRDVSIILADRLEASEALRAAEEELLSLEFAVSSETVHDVDVALLRAEEAQLRTALDAYIAQSILEEPIGVVSELDVHESGIPPTPLAMAIVIGLSVGMLIGVVGLVVVDRVRQPLWEITELEPRYRLPEVAARPRTYGEQATKPWYDTAPEGQRKAGIQELRSHVEGLPGFGNGLVVGVASLTGSLPDVHELAADLAAGLTSSGSWALLIDADYGNPSGLAEYRRHKLDLEEVVADPQETLVEAVRRADRDVDFIGVSISNRKGDAADSLAQPAFAFMLDTAQEMHDVVIVSCPPTDSASYHVLTQRLDTMILVAVAGDVIEADVVNANHTLAERRSFPAGVVLIRPRVGPVSLIMNQLFRPPPTPDPIGVQATRWQWSEHQYVQPTDRYAGDGAEGATDQNPAWQTREVASSANGPVPDSSTPFRNQGELDPVQTDPDPDLAEPVARVERITRRASNRQAGTVDDPDVEDSPWSFRQHEG